MTPGLSHLQYGCKTEVVFKFVQISIMLLTDNYFSHQSWLYHFHTIKNYQEK